MGDKAVPKAVTAPVGGTIVPKQTPTPWALEQKLNLQKADKIVVQTALAELGYYQSSIDGAIGPISRRAISAWQTANGQTAHGYLDINQYVALVDAANSGRAQAGRDLLPRTPIGPHRMLRGVASE
ncbi:MAG: peptidoglycan-binding protein [Rhodospirillaceae bacterium]